MESRFCTVRDAENLHTRILNTENNVHFERWVKSREFVSLAASVGSIGSVADNWALTRGLCWCKAANLTMRVTLQLSVYVGAQSTHPLSSDIQMH